jgi:putative membrane protein
MNTHKTELFHSLFRTIILFSFPLYMANLIKTGHIEYYIAPRMVDFVTWTVVALFLVALYQCNLTLTLLFSKSSVTCDCDHSAPKSWLNGISLYILFALPIAAGLFLPNTVLGSSMVSQRGINLTGSNFSISASSTQNASITNSVDTVTNQSGSSDTSTNAEIAKKFPVRVMASYAKLGMRLYQQPSIEVPDNKYMETLSSISLYLENFIGKEIKIKGFVYPDNNVTNNQFIIGRIGVNCCTADATPYGVIIENTGTVSYSKDTWLSITGTISKTKFNNEDVLMIKPSTIESISKPDSGFYVYPDPNFFASS